MAWDEQQSAVAEVLIGIRAQLESLTAQITKALQMLAVAKDAPDEDTMPRRLGGNR